MPATRGTTIDATGTIATGHNREELQIEEQEGERRRVNEIADRRGRIRPRFDSGKGASRSSVSPSVVAVVVSVIIAVAMPSTILTVVGAIRHPLLSSIITASRCPRRRRERGRWRPSSRRLKIMERSKWPRGAKLGI
ncbi:hypothetical protein K1719_021842 [Acacia pycnantha]|nr:hypothetical protein K1719_021842 [Acacia pycnantha]